MVNHSEWIARIILHRVVPAYHKNRKILLDSYHEASNVLRENENHLIELLGKKYAAKILDPLTRQEAEKEYQEIRSSGSIELVYYQDEAFPSLLLECGDFPLVLHKMGGATINPKRSLAIVGTRTPSSYASLITKQLIKELASYQPTIISGLAYGIDTIAHQEALNHNLPTIAILGSGIKNIYPSIHQKLAQRISQNGAILSEYTLHAKPTHYHFPQRNRLIAGSTVATLVLESHQKGGSMITAYLATDYHREVMTIPHALGSQHGEGCHSLIKKNIAHLIETGEDIANILGWDEQNLRSSNIPKQAIDLSLLTALQRTLYSYLQTNPDSHIDNIISHLQASQANLLAALLELELQGLVERLPGNLYRTA